jgi:Domain of unknown function (DUF4145)
MKPFSWTCPFCHQPTTITQPNHKEDSTLIELPTLDGKKILESLSIACPNPKCQKLAIRVDLYEARRSQAGYAIGDLVKAWQLIPSSNAKAFPDYIPTQIRDDYTEACEIRDLSPRASATLCRRCLQGMIRNFWGISESRLKDEIDALQDKVDSGTWQAIDAVRQIGNIGAHMEQDVDLIIDVEPEESQLLIDLIETLFESWYVDKHDREERNKELKALADKKRAEKTTPPKTP